MDTKTIRIAVIGAGNMGGAIVKGIAKGTVIRPEHITVSDISDNLLLQLKDSEPLLNTSGSNTSAIEAADIIQIGRAHV